MDYIIFDLEWNQPYSNDISFMKRARMPLTGEIIQIGAIKLNENLEIVDSFTMYVKPKYLPHMHKHVKALTGITNQDLNRGVPFRAAYSHFQQWCGKDYMLLSWGADDILILRENLLLHKLKSIDYDSWADAQMLYSYQRYGTTQQYSVAHAMEDLHISSEELSAHNALHDAIFTAHICQKLDLPTALLHYDSIRKEAPNPFLYPPGLTFFMYDNFQEKKRIVYDRRVRLSFCPYCQSRLETTRPERIQGDKHLSIGVCPKHGAFAIHGPDDCARQTQGAACGGEAGERKDDFGRDGLLFNSLISFSNFCMVSLSLLIVSSLDLVFISFNLIIAFNFSISLTI